MTDRPREGGTRPRLFYGWVIVAVTLLSDAIAVGMGPATFGVFLRPMSEALGWSRTAFTSAVTLQSLANVALSPPLGLLLDRYGARPLMVLGGATAAVCFMLMGKVEEVWQFYVLYTVAAALGLHELGGLITTTAVAKWFVRMRGRAIAISTLGNSIGGLVVAPLAAFLIGAVGWRSSWLVLGAVTAAVVLPPTILFMRNRPEDMGLRPDGDPPDAAPGSGLASGHRPSASTEVQWSLREALRTRTVWLLIISLNLSSMTISAVIYHQVALYEDLGFSLQAASLILSMNLGGGALSKLFWGFMAERIPVRYCLIASFLTRALAIFVLLLGSGPERAYVFAALYGLGGAYGTLVPILWADYYGRTFLGTIRGALTPFSLLASLGGPLFAAWTFDVLGSYTTAFWVFGATLILSTGIIYFARPPRKQPAPAAAAVDVPFPGSGQSQRSAAEPVSERHDEAPARPS